MRSLRQKVRPLPAVLRRLRRQASSIRPAYALEGYGSGDRAPDGGRPLADGPGGICEHLSGDERRIAYKMTDWRFSWEGGQ